MEYANQSLDAEQKKYQFGTSTTTAVLQSRSALATAESTLMSAMAAYEKSRVELEREWARSWTTTASTLMMPLGEGYADAQCSLCRTSQRTTVDAACAQPRTATISQLKGFRAAVFISSGVFLSVLLTILYNPRPLSRNFSR